MLQCCSYHLHKEFESFFHCCQINLLLQPVWAQQATPGRHRNPQSIVWKLSKRALLKALFLPLSILMSVCCVHSLAFLSCPFSVTLPSPGLPLVIYGFPMRYSRTVSAHCVTAHNGPERTLGKFLHRKELFQPLMCWHQEIIGSRSLLFLFLKLFKSLAKVRL